VFLELLALTGAAIAQPVLDVFGRAPEEFVRLGADRTDRWLFALAVGFVPAVVLIAVHAAVSVAGRRAGAWFHRALVGVLVALIAVPLGRSLLDVRGLLLGVLAALAGAAFAAAHGRWSPLGQWLRFASPLPVVAVVLFLFVSPVADLGGGAVAAPIELESTPARPVVMVVLDEFPLSVLLRRGGTIDEARYPNFAALARSSTWFRNATTVAARTEQAVPAMLTGQYPTTGIRAPVWSQYPDSLYRLLAGSYAMHVDEVITQLCPIRYCSEDRDGSALRTLLDLANDVWRDRVALDPAPRVAEAQVEEEFTGGARPQARRFDQFLDGIRAGEPARSLHFLHLLLPHVPWQVTADGYRYEYADSARLQFPGYDDEWSSQTSADAARVRLAIQTGYLDTLIGELIARLRATGLWDSAVVVVVADHGYSLLEGSPGRGIRAGTEELLSVPLFVRAPGYDSGVDDRPAQTVDVAPTIAAALGVELPWAVDGVSLFGEPRASTAHPFAYGNVGTSPKVVDIDVRDHLAWVLQAGNEQAVTAAAGDGRDHAFLALGPRPDLLGTTAAARDDLEPLEVVLEFPSRTRFDEVDLRAALPLHVVGHIAGGSPGTTVAIVVNGRVAGVAVTFTDASHAARWTALLEVRAFRAGDNRIEFARVAAERGS
jgi:hypothetical protein